MDANTRALPVHCEAGFRLDLQFLSKQKNFLVNTERAISDAEQAYTTALERGHRLFARRPLNALNYCWKSGEFESPVAPALRAPVGSRTRQICCRSV